MAEAVGDLQIRGSGDDALYTLVFADEDAFVQYAKVVGMKCDHCVSKAIVHTDRRDGDPRFCCGTHTAKHIDCPVCAVCFNCEDEATCVDDDGDFLCSDCYEARHAEDDSDEDDDDSGDVEGDEDDDEPADPNRVPEPEVIEAHEDGADYDERLWDTTADAADASVERE